MYMYTQDAFFVADLGALIRQHRKWARLLPRVVRMRYARARLRYRDDAAVDVWRSHASDLLTITTTIATGALLRH